MSSNFTPTYKTKPTATVATLTSRFQTPSPAISIKQVCVTDFYTTLSIDNSTHSSTKPSLLIPTPAVCGKVHTKRLIGFAPSPTRQAKITLKPYGCSNATSASSSLRLIRRYLRQYSNQESKTPTSSGSCDR